VQRARVMIGETTGAGDDCTRPIYALSRSKRKISKKRPPPWWAFCDGLVAPRRRALVLHILRSAHWSMGFRCFRVFKLASSLMDFSCILHNQISKRRGRFNHQAFCSF
jgi:hypothetical protein